MPGYVRVGDSPGYCHSVGPEKGSHRRLRDHQARAGILFRLGRPLPRRTDLWLPRGEASFGTRARLIARLAVHARRDARRRPPARRGQPSEEGEDWWHRPQRAAGDMLACSFFFFSLAFGRNGACLFVYQTAFLFTRWPLSQPPIDWITIRSLPPPPPSPLAPTAALIPLTCRGAAQLFVSPPGEGKRAVPARSAVAAAISDPRSVLCDDVPPACLTRRGGSRQAVLLCHYLVALPHRHFPSPCARF